MVKSDAKQGMNRLRGNRQLVLHLDGQRLVIRGLVLACACGIRRLTCVQTHLRDVWLGVAPAGTHCNPDPAKKCRKSRGTHSRVSSGDSHPCRVNASRRDDPLFRLVVVWWHDAVATETTECPSDAIDQDVRYDTGNDTICDAGSTVSTTWHGNDEKSLTYR